MDGNSDVNEADLTALKEKTGAGVEENGVMLDVIEFCQYPDYPTGCESVSLYMLLDYYGVDVTVDNIYDLLPMGTQPYDDEEGVRHGANPEREFVGDPRSDYSYGVFNDPIADVAEQFKPGAKTERGVTIDKIKEVLDTGNPVLAWYVSAPMRDIMYRWTWLDENDELVSWPGGEHAVVVCGYDGDSITYRDPNAGTTVCIDYATFEKSFTELGGRIVYYTDEEVEPPVTTTTSTATTTAATTTTTTASTSSKTTASTTAETTTADTVTTSEYTVSDLFTDTVKDIDNDSVTFSEHGQYRFLSSAVRDQFNSIGTGDEVTIGFEITKYNDTDIPCIDRIAVLSKTKPALGDVNLDGKIDARDASDILRYYAENSVNAQVDQIKARIMDVYGDLNGDGKTDAKDAYGVLAIYAANSTQPANDSKAALSGTESAGQVKT